MRFMTELQPLVRVLEMLNERRPNRKRPPAPLSLIASRGRVCIEHGQTTAQIEAIVWESGECTLPANKLLSLLKEYSSEGVVTIKADADGLYLGDLAIPVNSFHASASNPPAFQIYLTTDLGVVPSRRTPAVELSGAT